MNVTSPNRGAWSQRTKDTWFFLFLAATTAAVAYLFSPYLYVLMFAAVLVVVTWPIYQRILGYCRQRRAIAAVATLILLGIGIFGPVGTVVFLFVQDAVEVVQYGIDKVNEGAFTEWAASAVAYEDTALYHFLEPYLAYVLPENTDLVTAVLGPLQSATLGILETAGSMVPQLIEGTVNAGIDAVIFIFAVITLYMEGPKVLQMIKNLSPMDDAYEDHLLEVFREFANNVVLGSLATATVQGVVAAIGYAIAGADRVIFLGILTAVFSFIPMLGAAGVGLFVAIYVGVTVGWQWGLFVALWSLIVTGTVDNFLKPLFLRGSSNIHPLLIFLSVFGGLAWMGLPGLLVGPVIVAGFLALYTIYLEDYVGTDPPVPATAGATVAVPGVPEKTGPPLDVDPTATPPLQGETSAAAAEDLSNEPTDPNLRKPTS